MAFIHNLGLVCKNVSYYRITMVFLIPLLFNPPHPGGLIVLMWSSLTGNCNNCLWVTSFPVLPSIDTCGWSFYISDCTTCGWCIIQLFRACFKLEFFYTLSDFKYYTTTGCLSWFPCAFFSTESADGIFIFDIQQVRILTKWFNCGWFIFYSWCSRFWFTFFRDTFRSGDRGLFNDGFIFLLIVIFTWIFL